MFVLLWKAPRSLSPPGNDINLHYKIILCASPIFFSTPRFLNFFVCENFNFVNIYFVEKRRLFLREGKIYLLLSPSFLLGGEGTWESPNWNSWQIYARHSRFSRLNFKLKQFQG